LDAGAAYVLYQWNDGNPNQTRNVNTEGFYFVTVTDANGCVGTSEPFFVDEYDTPAPVIQGPLTFCQGDGTTLFLPDSAQYSSIEWRVGATNVGTGGSRYFDETTANITVRVVSLNGCPGVSTNVSVTEFNQLLPTISGPNAICLGASATLTVDGGYATYEWFLNNAPVPGADQQTLAVSTAGDYTVRVTDAFGCEGVSPPFAFTVNALPDVWAQAAPICAGATATLEAFGAQTYVWNGGGLGNVPGQTVTDAPIATTQYTVTGTDANGCVQTATVTLVVHPLPNAVIEGATVFCTGQSTELTARPDGAVYLWSNNEISQTITVTAGGDYSVTVTEANGCVNTFAVTVVQLDSLQPTITGPAAYCTGFSAQLCVQAPGNYTSFDWRLNGVSVGNSACVNATAPGTYVVRVANAAGCTGSGTFDLIENALPNVVAQAAPICVGQTGTLSADGAQTYVWSGGGLTNVPGQSVDVSPAATTEYTVTGTDANACVNSATVTLVVHPLPTFTVSGPTTVCEGQTGTITVTAPGGATVAYCDGTTGATFVYNQTLTCDFTVTSPEGCVSTGVLHLTVSDTSRPVILGALQYCAGSSTTLSVENAANYAAIEWTTNETGPQITVTSPGVYGVRVHDGSGCWGRAEVAVVENPNPAPQISGAAAICPGTTTTLSADAGYAAYQWALNDVPLPGAFNPVYAAGVPGNYSVIVTDANGCTAAASHVLVFYPLPDSTIGGMLSFCTNNSTTLTAPSAPPGTVYEYLWGPDGQTTPSIVVTEGNREFWVRVTDVNTGCFSDDTVYVFQADTLEPQISGPNRYCAGGGVTLAAESGYATYEWRRAGNPAILSATNSLAVNAPGFYTVRVTDAAGCAGSDTLTVFEIPDPTPQIVPDGPTMFCEGGAVTLTVGAGYTGRRWFRDNTLLAGETGTSIIVTVSGTYRVEVDSTNLNCSGFDEIEITVNPNPVPVITGPAQICTGFVGVLTVNYPDSYNISWNTTENTTNIMVAAGGTYSVTVTNPATGCVGTASFVVTQLDTLAPTITGPYSFCVGQSATLAVVETFATYQWYRDNTPLNGETASTLSVSQAGVYGVRVTDADGCTGSGTWAVVVNPLPEPQPYVSSGDLLLCPGETATLAVDNVFASYVWNGVSGTHEFVVNAAGVYEVTVASDSGCVASATIAVEEAPVPSSQIIGPAQYCIGQTTTLAAAVPGMVYLWTPTLEETPSITVSAAGTHTLRVTDPVSGCYSETTVDVPAPADSLMPIIAGAGTYCAGASVELSVSDGPYAEYRWYAAGSNLVVGTGSTLVATAGIYFVWVSNGSCSGTSAPFEVSELPLPDPQISGVFAVCPGGTFQLTAITGYDVYHWVHNGNVIGFESSLSPTEAGEYTLAVWRNGCSASATQNLIFHPLPDSAITGSLQICAGESTTLAAPSGNYSYAWTLDGAPAGDAQTLTVSQPGEVTLRVTDLATGCVSDSTVTVVQATELTPEIVGDLSVCEGTTTVLDAGADYDTYRWTLNGAEIGTGRTVEVSRPAGTYTVRLEVTRGACAGFDEALVVFTPNPTTAILGNLTICEGESTVLSLNSIPPTVVWRFNGAVFSTEAQITVSEPGTYEVSVTDENGCSVSETATVVRVLPPVLSVSASTVCAGIATDLAVTVDGVQEYTVGWIGEGGLSGTGTSLRHTYPGVGQYPFTVRVDYGPCFVETTGVAVVVAQPGEPLLIGDRVCAGAAARAFVLVPDVGQVYWYDRPTGGSPIFVGDTLSIPGVSDTTTYWAERVVGGCVSDRSPVGISVIAAPLAQFIADPPVGSVMYLPNATVKFTAEGYSINAQRYYWDFGDSTYSNEINPTHTYTETGEYRVLLYAYNENCVDTFSMAPFVVKVSDSLSVPNIFTPNGDGVNDVVKIFGIEDARTYEFAVYDRWGVYLFGAKDEKNHFWDGTFRGKTCPEGVYYYVLKAEMNSGAKHKLKGSITLIR
jgi:gliding motility-associated-like protein